MKAIDLALASLRHRPARVVLTSLATAASVCVVLWVSSSYEALAKSVDHFSSMALGKYPLAVGPISEAAELAVPAEVSSALAADPAVASVDPMWLARVEPLGRGQRVRPQGSPGGGDRRGLAFARGSEPGSGPPGTGDSALLALELREPPFPLSAGQWLSSSAQSEVVLGVAFAKERGLALGDELRLREASEPLRVVGIMDVPAIVDSGRTLTPARILVPAAGELFVRRPEAERLLGRAGRDTFLALALRPQSDLNAFRFGWAPRLAQAATPVQFQEAHQIEEALDEASTVENMQLQAYVATGISLLVALLVVLSTLNMGVSERIRQLAVVRALGFTRGEVALTIGVEALALAGCGFLGGVALAALVLGLIASRAPEVMKYGVPIGPRGLGLAALASFGGAALAAILPAWRATRVRPLDALAPGSRARDAQQVPRWLLPLGLALIALNPLLLVGLPLHHGQVGGRALAGFLSMCLGFLLVAAPLVALVDRLGGPLLARLLRIEPRLLTSQLTSNLWRSVGAALSLSVGLSLFMTVQVWGYTMLGAFLPGPWAPEAILAFLPGGISPAQATEVRKLPGVDPARCYPLVVEQPRLEQDLTGSAERASVVRQDNVVIVGLDPEAVAGRNPLLRLTWVEGSPAEALPALREGRGCVVPDHFLREANLKLGDEFALVPPERPEVSHRYRIVGAVSLQGWHWQTKHVGFRVRSRRAAALVFARYEQVAADFELGAASHVWFGYDPKGADPDVVGEAARALYQRLLEREVTLGRNPDDEWAPFVRVLTVERITQVLLGAAQRWLWLIGQVPLIALAIASLGVLNVILASVRARRWDFGVLRSLGFTRAELVRAVIAEGLLLGLVAIGLSLGFGILAGWSGAELAQYTSFFGGMHPPLVVPLLPLAYGVGACLLLTGLAAAWPAAQVGRTEPRSLLQEGRGAF